MIQPWCARRNAGAQNGWAIKPHRVIERRENWELASAHVIHTTMYVVIERRTAKLRKACAGPLLLFIEISFCCVLVLLDAVVAPDP